MGFALNPSEISLIAAVSFADSDELSRLLGRTDIFKDFKIRFDEEELEIIFEIANGIEQ